MQTEDSLGMLLDTAAQEEQKGEREKLWKHRH